VKEPTLEDLNSAVFRLRLVATGYIGSLAIMVGGFYRLFRYKDITAAGLCFFMAICLNYIADLERDKLKWIVDAIESKKSDSE
jgi:hypothetical protein